jgi:phenylpropionate dioxygenase-like ring-hydroxylating dioxygenase large terminal subunit
MTLAYQPVEMLNMVDAEKGTVDRRIFSDKDIYQLELEQIFARAWNFMCPDSQIPNPGDFFMSYVGEDRVICVRDNDGNPQVLVNTCRHRGNAVCRADEGHATSFMCTYHGWTYDLKGNLVGVPGFKEVYHEELDRENWGLIKGKAEAYHGWIFATLDLEAPDLYDYLGEVGRMGIDQVYARGDTLQVMGIQKNIINCNWKFAVDNAWDWYHALLTHSSAGMAGWRAGYIVAPGEPETEGLNIMSNDAYDVISVLGEYGHAIGGWAFDRKGADAFNYGLVDQTWRDRPESQQILGDVGLRSAAAHPNIFPNLWIFNTFSKASLRIPRGPMATEIWWFVFGNPEATEERQRYLTRRALHHDGPSGMFEQDDGENWSESTKGTKSVVARRYPLNYSMNVGKGEVVDDEAGPPRIDGPNSEAPQLWYYESWSKWMAAQSWPELTAWQRKPEAYR